MGWIGLVCWIGDTGDEQSPQILTNSVSKSVEYVSEDMNYSVQFLSISRHCAGK